jgi:hypothetical protein
MFMASFNFRDFQRLAVCCQSRIGQIDCPIEQVRACPFETCPNWLVLPTMASVAFPQIDHRRVGRILCLGAVAEWENRSWSGTRVERAYPRESSYA